MENLAQYLAAVLGKEEKMWMLFLNNFILCCINAPLHKCACELEASSSSTLPRGRQEEEGIYRTSSLREVSKSEK